MRVAFVTSVLSRLIRQGALKTNDSVLCVCADKSEVKVFESLGFSNVVISNTHTHLGPNPYPPFAFRREDTNQLSFPDNTFDIAFVSDGIHHCRLPHKAVTEMFRVSRKGIIVFESRDNLLMRTANRLNLSPVYELDAVVSNGFKFGGVDNTHIPNFIYRWTEREFEKTINTFHPIGRNGFQYFYTLSLPYEQARLMKLRLKLMVLNVVRPLVWTFTKIFPRQGNTFCLIAWKASQADGLWPWLKVVNGEIVYNQEY